MLQRHPLRAALALLAAALVACVVGYLVLAVPGTWFPDAPPKGWSAAELVLARGAGGLGANDLVLTGVDATGSALVTVNTDFRSTDYPAIAWAAIDVSEQTDVWLLWRSDYAPAKLNSMPLTVASGRLLPASLAGNPNWVGRITGLGLTLRGPVPQPVRIRGVAAKPMGAAEVLGDRIREWLAFEGLTGTSMDSVTGGADVQDLPLPVLLAASVAVAALAWLGLARHAAASTMLPTVFALLFVAAWILQDARWTWDLARDVDRTARQYAGLDWRGRHLAAEDGALFAAIEGMRARLPATPARVFVAADANYFRGRAAYHLYPHNVFYAPYQDAIPATSRLRPGDYVVVYQRRGVQFDPAAQRLRWDGGEPIAAELLLAGSGAALFRIR